MNIARQYELLRTSDDGGMGTVYEARQFLPLNQTLPVAVKVLAPQDEQNRAQSEEMFRRESLTSMQHNHQHPNLVTTHHAGISANGYSYLVMELVHGVTLKGLKAIAAGGTLSFPVIRRIARDVLSGLELLHGREVIHRDIKPSNILLAGDGTAKVADFGLVKTAYETGSGCFRGTPAYASPESLQGFGLTEQADLYSVGIVLYELISGALPYKSDDPRALLAEIVGNGPPPLPEGTPPDLVALVAGLLETEIEENAFSTASEAIAVLDACSEEIAEAKEIARLVGERASNNAANPGALPDLGWPFEDAMPPAPSLLATLSWMMVPIAFTMGLALAGLVFGHSSTHEPERQPTVSSSSDNGNENDDANDHSSPAPSPPEHEKETSPKDKSIGPKPLENAPPPVVETIADRNDDTAKDTRSEKVAEADAPRATPSRPKTKRVSSARKPRHVNAVEPATVKQPPQRADRWIGQYRIRTKK